MKNSISITDRAAIAALLADAKDLLYAIDNGFVPGDPASAYVAALRRSVARMEAQK
jgi:hypothetical protein